MWTRYRVCFLEQKCYTPVTAVQHWAYLVLYILCYKYICLHMTCNMQYLSNKNFAHVYVSCFHMLVQFVYVRVCVLPSEMECVLFYSRKIAHRANVICCIMYPTCGNKFYLILSYLNHTVTVWDIYISSQLCYNNEKYIVSIMTVYNKLHMDYLLYMFTEKFCRTLTCR